MKQENKINANDLFHNVIKRPHAFRGFVRNSQSYRIHH